MKDLFFFTRVICSVFFCALATAPAAWGAPILGAATFDTVYVPGGFDSNDNVQFVGEGLFRNTCYRPATPTVDVDHKKKTITVGPTAYEYSGLCLQVVLPFNRVVDVGLLQPGQYTIKQRTNGSTLGTVNVAPARTENPDDYLYAPVSQAFFKQKGLVSEVMLTGDFMSNCMSLDQVEVTIEPKVIVLQPLMKIEPRNGCLRGRFPFSKLVQIDLIPPGRYLLHVRSMNGNAVNTLVEVH